MNATTKHVFTRDEMFTENVEYTAKVWKLTGIQWQVLNGINGNQLALGAVSGLIAAEALNVVDHLWKTGSFAGYSPVKIAMPVIAIVAVFVIGRAADRKRRTLVRKINRTLLSDEELGL